MIREVIEYATMREYGILSFPSVNDIQAAIDLANERDCIIKLSWKYEDRVTLKQTFLTKYDIAEDVYNKLN